MQWLNLSNTYIQKMMEYLYIHTCKICVSSSAQKIRHICSVLQYVGRRRWRGYPVRVRCTRPSHSRRGAASRASLPCRRYRSSALSSPEVATGPLSPLQSRGGHRARPPVIEGWGLIVGGARYLQSLGRGGAVWLRVWLLLISRRRCGHALGRPIRTCFLVYSCTHT